MGRKGVGKLAPFGICKTIEVISAGGELISDDDKEISSVGYLTSHIILCYDEIVNLGVEHDDRYKPTIGKQDGSLSESPGTRVILANFNYRKVPDMQTLGRQISQRFGIQSDDWHIRLSDNTKCGLQPVTVGQFHIDTMPSTKISFQADGKVIGPDGKPEAGLQAGFDHEEKFHPVSGWVAYSKTPYSDELMAGVRIYCRGKIASQTSIFNQRAGFTGEHNIRSYLVGELHADWIDQDDDLIQTDRRDILWSDDLATAFQNWGQCIIKRVGSLSRDPLQKATLDLFLETGNVDERILDAFPGHSHKDIRDCASEFVRSFGRKISRGEAGDPETVKQMVDLGISLAPHITLNSIMREAINRADTPLSVLGNFLSTARLAELSSFGRIAEDRLKVVDRLDFLKNAKDTDENDLQKLITEAPWLVNPEWAPVTENQTFTSLRREFENYYKEKTGNQISLAEFENTNRRPDFVLSSQEGVVQIIEIKKPHHELTNPEMDRIVVYHDNMEAFLKENPFNDYFRDFHITLVCDGSKLTGSPRAAFNGYRDSGKMTLMNWTDFLLRTKQVHQDFLEEAMRQRELTSAASS